MTWTTRLAASLPAISLLPMAVALALPAADDGSEPIPGIAKPAADARPFVRWWWNGVRVTEKEIAREIAVMHAAGIGGFEINSIAMPEGANPDSFAHAEPKPWLSPEWARLVAFAADEAHRLGMTADLIIGSGWPFGAQFLDVSEQTQRVRLVKREFVGPARIELDLAEVAAEPKKKGKHDGDEVPPTRVGWAFARVLPEGASSGAFSAGAEFPLPTGAGARLALAIPEGRHVAYLGIREWGFTHVKLGAPGADGPVVDHWNANAVRRYLDRMAEAIEPTFGGALGTKIRALFVDSLELDKANWTDDLPAEFLKRRGYDIEPYLPFVLDDDADRAGPFFETVRRARQDFSRTLIDLFEERFLGTVTAFCDAHGVLARVQAYGRETHPIHGGLKVHLPEGETWFWNDREHEKRILVESTSANKLVSSAAHLRGQARVSFEAMTNAVPVFRETPPDFKRGADLSFLDGLNHPILHGFNYTPPEAGFPGWVRFGCYFNERSPWWPLFPKFSDYVARVGTALRAGESVADVAILLPLPDEMGRHGRLYQPFPELRDPWYVYHIGAAVQSTGHGADYVSERILQAAQVAEGRLSFGPQAYSVLVLPEVRSLELESAQKVETFVTGGGELVVIGATPSKEPGLSGSADRDGRVRDLFAALAKRFPTRVGRVAPPVQSGGREGLVLWAASALEHVASRGAVAIGHPSAHISQVLRRLPTGHVLFAANTDVDRGEDVHFDFRFPHAGGLRLDSETGRWVALVPAGSETTVLPLGPQESCLLFFPAPGSAFAVTGAVDTPVYPDFNDKGVPVNVDRWEIEAVRAGNGAKIQRTLATLQDCSLSNDPELASFGGEVIYRGSFEAVDPRAAWFDLGAVQAAATVTLNGQPLGDRWYGRPIFRAKEALRQGTNTIEIRLYTSLANLMHALGSQDATAKRWAFWFSPMPTGVIGPIVLRPDASLAN